LRVNSGEVAGRAVLAGKARARTVHQAICMQSIEGVDRLREARRIAVVGVSIGQSDPTRVLFRALVAHGFDVVPVRAGVATLEGRPCHASILDVPVIDVAVIGTPPRFWEMTIDDCRAAGVGMVWLDPGGLRGVSASIIDYCRRRAIDVIAGAEPLAALGRPRRCRRWTPSWLGLRTPAVAS
jgi:predicted CoA-binding protein